MNKAGIKAGMNRFGVGSFLYSIRPAGRNR